MEIALPDGRSVKKTAVRMRFLFKNVLLDNLFRMKNLVSGHHLLHLETLVTSS